MRKTWRSEWHSKKYFKYDPLCEVIKLNGWEVHLFPIEVGARGYCGTSTKACLSRLGFSGKNLRSPMKALSLASLEASLKASFHIWQSRELKVWNNPDEPVQSCPPLKSNKGVMKSKPVFTKHYPPSTSKSSLKSDPPSHKVGLYNKGNTCYVNACLKCLSVIPGF